jgi:SAM-dependent methyltransferase
VTAVGRRATPKRVSLGQGARRVSGWVVRAVSHVEKFDRLSSTFSERDYADPARYPARRAELIVGLAPRSQAGDTLVDLGCGDGNMAAPFAAYGLAYLGIDASPGMIEVARARHDGLHFEVAELEAYAPPEPVDCVVCLRALKYVEDRVGFFSHVRGYTRGKFVFDVDLRLLSAELLERELTQAGFREVGFRPFFLPQLRRVPLWLHPAIRALERTGPLTRLVARRHGIFFCAARP